MTIHVNDKINLSGNTLINVGPTNATIDGSAVGTVTTVNSKQPTLGAVTVTASDIAINDINGIAVADTVQGAIEGLFQYANSGKTQVAAAIGTPATSDNTFAQLATHITNLKNKTYGVAKSVLLDEAVQADDVIESYYRTMGHSKLPNLTSPTGLLSATLCCSSSDNGYFAVGTNATPYHALYSQSGDTFTKLTDIATGLPTGQTNGIALSKDATYLAMATGAGAFLRVYKRSGDLFSAITISVNVPSAGRAVAFSPDAQFLAVGHGYSGTPLQSLTVYQRSGDTFTKPAISDQPPDDVYGVSWSSDGIYLACTHLTAPFVTIYKRTGTTFAKIANQPTGGNPTGNPFGIAFSPDDKLLAVAHTTAPFVTVYQRTDDAFAKLPDIPSPGNTCRSVAWSPDSAYLTVGIGANPFVKVYKRVGETFTEQSNPTGATPTGTANGAVWSYDAGYYMISHTVSPYISVYKNTSTTYLFRKVATPATVTVGRLDKIFGIAKEAGTAGQTKSASIIVGGVLLP